MGRRTSSIPSPLPVIAEAAFLTVYSNSLLATLNARKMIRGAADGIQSTGDNLSLSLRDFPKNGTMSSRVSHIIGSRNLR